MILDTIVEDKKRRLMEHKAAVSEEEMRRMALASGRKSISFHDALAKEGLSIIGEFKKASPSMGKIFQTDQRYQTSSHDSEGLYHRFLSDL